MSSWPIFPFLLMMSVLLCDLDSVSNSVSVQYSVHYIEHILSTQLNFLNTWTPNNAICWKPLSHIPAILRFLKWVSFVVQQYHIQWKLGKKRYITQLKHCCDYLSIDFNLSHWGFNCGGFVSNAVDIFNP